MNIIYMYRFKATITVRQGRVATDESEQALQNYAKDNLLPVLLHPRMECRQSFAYYHPDEESEMKGIDYVELNIRILRDCKRFRSVLSLSQLVRALSDLFDDTADTQVLCQIHDPEIVPPDEYDVFDSERQHTPPDS